MMEVNRESIPKTLTVFRIGHSTRCLEELGELLRENGVRALEDIRRFPRSHRNPQFNLKALESALPSKGIKYVWMESLGGFRNSSGQAAKDTALKNIPFRNYAAYMETEDFSKGVETLLSLARETTVAIMCAEALYWRCHRSLVSDYLKSKGVRVIHILSRNRCQEHSYTQCTRIVDGQLTYHQQ